MVNIKERGLTRHCWETGAPPTHQCDGYYPPAFHIEYMLPFVLPHRLDSILQTASCVSSDSGAHNIADGIHHNKLCLPMVVRKHSKGLFPFAVASIPFVAGFSFLRMAGTSISLAQEALCHNTCKAPTSYVSYNQPAYWYYNIGTTKKQMANGGLADGARHGRWVHDRCPRGG